MQTHYTPNPRREQQSFPTEYLERVYRRPRPYLWAEDWARFHHIALPGMTVDELAMELSNVWRRITMEKPRADDWLWSRRAACFAERDRRRATGRRVA